MSEQAALEAWIDQAQQSLKELAQQARVPGEQADLLAETLEQLTVAVEELSVAGEELREQNEELVQARESVEAERQRYEVLFEFAPDGYLVTDAHGIIREGNRAAAELLGVAGVRLVGKPLAVYVDRGDRGCFVLELARLGGAAEGDRKRWEMRMHPRAGAAFEGELTVLAVRGAQGRVTGFRWMLRDVTQAKQAQARLRFQTDALGHVGDAIVAVDSQMRVTYANRAAAEGYGFDLESAPGRPLGEVYESRWLGPADEARGRTELAETGHWRGRNVHVTPTGQEFTVESVVSALSGEDGQAGGADGRDA